MSLAPNKSAQLQSIVSSPGYKVILELLEEECSKAEAELLAANPALSNVVLAHHAEARAFRLLVNRFRQTIDREVTGALSPAPEPEELSPRQIVELQYR